jgi:hypothetical protein
LYGIIAEISELEVTVDLLLNIAMQVSVNGLISFGTGNNAFMPHQSPPGFNGIAVYFADVSPVCGSSRVTGDIFYRITTGMQHFNLCLAKFYRFSSAHFLLESSLTFSFSTFPSLTLGLRH